MTVQRDSETPLDVHVEPDKNVEADRKLYAAVLNFRRATGYFLGGLAMLLVLGGAYLSFGWLHNLPPPTNDLERGFRYAQMGAHAVGTIAVIWFLYQLLRAAERMVLPFWLVESNPEVARLLLGITDPVSAGLKIAKETAQVAGEFAAAAESVKK